MFPLRISTKVSIKNFFSKCDQIRSFLRIWLHLLKKSFLANFIFCAAYVPRIGARITWHLDYFSNFLMTVEQRFTIWYFVELIGCSSYYNLGMLYQMSGNFIRFSSFKTWLSEISLRILQEPWQSKTYSLTMTVENVEKEENQL